MLIPTWQIQIIHQFELVIYVMAPFEVLARRDLDSLCAREEAGEQYQGLSITDFFLVSWLVDPICWVLEFFSARHNRGGPMVPICQLKSHQTRKFERLPMVNRHP